MLKIKCKQLRLSSKGNLKRIICNGIPVLSIFAILGILTYAISFVSAIDNRAYAVENNISTQSSNDPSVSLEITGGSAADAVIEATYGVATYRNHIITISANNIESYILTISGPTNLSGPTTITGTNGKTYDSLEDNTWGYSWGEQATLNSAPMAATYYALSPSGSNLSCGDVVSNQIECTQHLNFAVKFADDAEAGHYTADVNLSLTVTPKQVTDLSSITYLQDITPEICANSPMLQNFPLKDNRDDNTYTVAKLDDNRCWMTQNLRLTREGLLDPNKVITSTDSNVTNNYYPPTSSGSGFSSANFYANQLYYPGDETHGAYYSWTAATAGTGSSSLTIGNAPGDICPKNWQLPRGGSDGDFQTLATAANFTNNAAGSAKMQDEPYNFQLSGFIAMGHNALNQRGMYWASYASDSRYAANLLFTATQVSPQSGYDRYNGFSIRCIAK